MPHQFLHKHTNNTRTVNCLNVVRCDELIVCQLLHTWKSCKIIIQLLRKLLLLWKRSVVWQIAEILQALQQVFGHIERLAACANSNVILEQPANNSLGARTFQGTEFPCEVPVWSLRAQDSQNPRICSDASDAPGTGDGIFAAKLPRKATAGSCNASIARCNMISVGVTGS